MINVISQSLGLDVVNINAYANFYQNIPNGLMLSTFFTDRPVTKSSQTEVFIDLRKVICLRKFVSLTFQN